MPWGGLLALFSAGFLGILNETVPAGLLPRMAADLRLPEAVVGQVTTVYALATAVTAIPLQRALRHFGRRTVLLWALAGFALAGGATAVLPDLTGILVARFVGGVAAGVIWSNIGGVAGRISPDGRQSRGVAVALAGTPVALSLGLPAGTVLGAVAGWRSTFAVIAVASVVVLLWTLLVIPRLPAGREQPHDRLVPLLRRRGVLTIVLVVLGFITAHNLLYTYIAPVAAAAGLRDGLGWVLLDFGVAALISIWVVGALIEGHHRRLTLASTVLLGAGALAVAASPSAPAALLVGVALWGLGFGGSATLFLTAALRAAASDGVQAVVVTAFNVSIAVGGLVGGLLLAGFGIGVVPWAALVLVVPVGIAVLAARRHAFPA